MWRLKPNQIRDRRQKAGLTLQALADRVELHRRTLERIESGETDRLKAAHLEALAKALKCKIEDLGWPEGQSNAETPPPRRSPAESIAKTNPSSKQARREQMIGIARPTLVWEGKTIPILSFTLQLDCEIFYRPMAEAAETIAICGAIRDVRPMPSDVAAVLGVERGTGACYCVVQREIPLLGQDGESDPLRSVVWIPSEIQGRQLVALHGASSQVVVFARMVRNESTGDWRGFPTHDSEEPYRPWAWVSEGVALRGEFVEQDIDPQKTK